MPEAHEHRQVAESFGVDAARYDRARPPYPDALVRRIVAAGPGPDVLDVGCGTGIVARQFQAAGCTVLGVEPDARMADFARGRGIDVDVATFEAWAAGGRTFDAVVAGTAWHWVDPVAGAAKAADVLRPDGCLAVFGHVFQLPPAMLHALDAVYRRVAPDAPFDVAAMGRALDGYQAMYTKVADVIRASGGFRDVQESRWDWERTYTRDEWLDQLPTTGGLTRLAPGPLAEVLDVAGAAVDAMGGSVTLPYATVAVIALRDK